MKDAVLIELVNRWEALSRSHEIGNGSPEAAFYNAEMRGRRISMERCANDLRLLIDVLGDIDKENEKADQIPINFVDAYDIEKVVIKK